jgi:hypothetical protein
MKRLRRNRKADDREQGNGLPAFMRPGDRESAYKPGKHWIETLTKKLRRTP